MKDNPDLRSGQFTGTFTRQVAQQKWREVTNILNSISGGVSKDWPRWRKVRFDYALGLLTYKKFYLKKNTISKNSRIKKSLTATGGGPPCLEQLTDLEIEILGTIPAVSVEGHSSIEESHVIFEFVTENVSQVIIKIYIQLQIYFYLN